VHSKYKKTQQQTTVHKKGDNTTKGNQKPFVGFVEVHPSHLERQ